LTEQFFLPTFIVEEIKMVKRKLSTFRFVPFWLISILLVCLLRASSCSFFSDKSPEGRLLRHSDCKSFIEGSHNLSNYDHPPSEECLEYHYDGHGVLTLKHINAGFNCCPGTISADIVFRPGEIIIKEKEASSLCDCNCLFDLDYQLIHIRPGVYRISVKGPYQPESDPPLEFVVSLTQPVSGTFCVPRSQYPWAI